MTKTWRVASLDGGGPAFVVSSAAATATRERHSMMTTAAAMTGIPPRRTDCADRRTDRTDSRNSSSPSSFCSAGVIEGSLTGVTGVLPGFCAEACAAQTDPLPREISSCQLHDRSARRRPANGHAPSSTTRTVSNLALRKRRTKKILQIIHSMTMFASRALLFPITFHDYTRS